MELKNRQRFFLGVFFFLTGMCFSTWASRIPTIKTVFGYNDAELGTILLFMPVSSLVGLPVSGWLISRFDSRLPMTIAFMSLTISLLLIGFAVTTFTLIASVCLFAFSLRILNIAMNTQAITLQRQFDKRINGAFHGLWSTGGIAGVGFSTWMVAADVPMNFHLLAVSGVTLFVVIFSYRFLLHNDRSTTGNKLIIGRPDPYILYLGILVFLASICEGGMFDWSGIFFREVVKEEIFTLGYLTFMVCMALSRFASDRIIEMIGMPKTYFLSAALIFGGIMLAVNFPGFWPSMIGFCLTGFGTASVIPMTFLLAGASKKYSPGMAISLIATYGIVGWLIGPPLIGYLAHAFDLRIAFLAFALSGGLLVPVSLFFFRHQKSIS